MFTRAEDSCLIRTISVHCHLSGWTLAGRHAIKGCSAHSTSCIYCELNIAAFYGPVVVDAILYAMTVARILVQRSRCAKVRMSLGWRKNGRSLFSVLYRDGSIYFLVVAIAMVITMLGFFYMPLTGPFTESDLYLAVCSIACSRLILHLMGRSRSDARRVGIEKRVQEPERGGVGDLEGVRWQSEEAGAMSSQPEFETMLGFSALMTEM